MFSRIGNGPRQWLPVLAADDFREMDKQSLADFIQRSLPVAGPALNEMLAHFDARSLRKNEFLLRAGQVNDEYLFLEAGFLRAFTFDPDGNDVTTYFHSPDSVVFEAASFFLRTASVENIQALTDCCGCSISYGALNALFHTIPEGREFGRKMLVHAFVAFKQRTLALVNESAEQRYTHLLATNPALFQHAQLRHIASYLGVTDTSLSRIRRAAFRSG